MTDEQRERMIQALNQNYKQMFINGLICGLNIAAIIISIAAIVIHCNK